MEPACIAEGDLVIVYFSKDQLSPIIVELGKQLNSRYGHYVHADLVGKPFGSKVPSSNGKGFAYLLKPTPELWTVSLPHRTQILYMPDISFITSYLDIVPGSRVVEAGTGSGSFSHAVARTVGPAGKLFSYEFHQDRYEQARDEFKQHGLTQIDIQHRNVCKDGFVESLADSIDAVFLDLPAPWEAVEAAKSALKKDRPSRICCFSPCIEQVLRTVTALGASGFSDITMYEALVKMHDHVVLPEPPATIFDVMSRLKSVEVHKEARRLRQMERAKKGKEKDTDVGEKRSREEDGTDDAESNKRMALDPADGESSSAATTPAQQQQQHHQKLDPKVARPPTSTRYAKVGKNQTLAEDAQVHSRVLPQLRGHTSYLTFATLLPLAAAGAETATTSNGDSEAAKTEAAKTTVPAAGKLSREESDALIEGVTFETPESTL